LFFLAAGAVAILIMLGTPVARLAVFLVPPLRVAALSRFGFIAITGLTIAGAIGVDAMFSKDGPSSPRRFRPLAITGTITAAVIALIIIAFLSAQRGHLTEERQWMRTMRSTTTAMELLGAAVAVLWLAPRLRRSAAVAVPIGLIGLDLLAFAEGFHAFMPRDLAFPAIPEFTEIEADRGLFRVAGWRNALPPNTALVYGFQDFRSYDGVGIRHYSDLLDVGFGFGGGSHELVNAATPHLLDLLNIKYVLTPPDVDLPADRFQILRDGPMRIYVNQRVSSRAFLVDSAVVVDGNDARRVIRDGNVDLARVAVLAQPIDAGLEPAKAEGDLGSAIVQRYEDELVSVGTRADGRRLLVLSDVYYPGWVATVDGAPVPIHRADYAFRAVSVPAGEHLVEFRYRPASVRYGAWASAAGVLLVGGLFRKRRTGDR
jgi:hypothetical protein